MSPWIRTPRRIRIRAHRFEFCDCPAALRVHRAELRAPQLELRVHRLDLRMHLILFLVESSEELYHLIVCGLHRLAGVAALHYVFFLCTWV